MSCVIARCGPVSFIRHYQKELVEDGLVKKTIFPELPPRSEYSITSLGLTLIPIIDAMLEWGKKNKDLFERKYGK